MIDLKCNTCSKSTRPEAPVAYRCHCDSSFEVSKEFQAYSKSVRKDREESLRYKYQGDYVDRDQNVVIDSVRVISHSVYKPTMVFRDRGDDALASECLDVEWTIEFDAGGREDHLSSMGIYVTNRGTAIVTRDASTKSGEDREGPWVFQEHEDNGFSQYFNLKAGDTVDLYLSVMRRANGKPRASLNEVKYLNNWKEDYRCPYGLRWF